MAPVIIAIVVVVVVAGIVATVVWARRRHMTLLVWNKYQRLPATVYGRAHFGRSRFRVKVCENANTELDKLGRDKALIYHFD